MSRPDLYQQARCGSGSLVFSSAVSQLPTESKVRLACHPDDPPIARHWGVTQVLNSVEGLDRLLAIGLAPKSETNG